MYKSSIKYIGNEKYVKKIKKEQKIDARSKLTEEIVKIYSCSGLWYNKSRKGEKKQCFKNTF